MLLVSHVQKDKQNQMTDDEKTFGIDKLNIKRSEIPAVTLIIQQKFKLFMRKQIKSIMI